MPVQGYGPDYLQGALMSKVDDVFRPIPVTLLNEWGFQAVFVEVTGNSNYDPSTGDITPAETRWDVQIVIDNLEPEERQGQQQTGDWLIYVKPEDIDDHYITTRDRFEIPEGSGTRVMKVVDVLTYRGERPVFYECVCRSQ